MTTGNEPVTQFQ